MIYNKSVLGNCRDALDLYSNLFLHRKCNATYLFSSNHYETILSVNVIARESRTTGGLRRSPLKLSPIYGTRADAARREASLVIFSTKPFS